MCKMAELRLNNRTARICIRRIICFTAILFILFVNCAFSETANEIALVLTEKEWTWEESSYASFEGTVTADHALPDKIRMELSLTTVPDADENGEIFFQTVNEKKLTLRKQKAEYTFSAEGLTGFGFTGSWKTPETVPFSQVDITCQIYDEDGTALLAEQKMTVSRDASEIVEKDDGKFRIRENLSEWTLWAAIAAAVIWILAVIRVILNHSKMKKER